MSVPQCPLPKEEIARRGDTIYEQQVRPQVEAGNYGKVVALDVLTGAYILDKTALAAARRLRSTHPQAVIWFVRVGHRAFVHLGGREFRRQT